MRLRSVRSSCGRDQVFILMDGLQGHRILRSRARQQAVAHGCDNRSLTRPEPEPKGQRFGAFSEHPASAGCLPARRPEDTPLTLTQGARNSCRICAGIVYRGTHGRGTVTMRRRYRAARVSKRLGARTVFIPFGGPSGPWALPRGRGSDVGVQRLESRGQSRDRKGAGSANRLAIRR